MVGTSITPSILDGVILPYSSLPLVSMAESCCPFQGNIGGQCPARDSTGLPSIKRKNPRTPSSSDNELASENSVIVSPVEPPQ